MKEKLIDYTTPKGERIRDSGGPTDKTKEDLERQQERDFRLAQEHSTVGKKKEKPEKPLGGFNRPAIEFVPWPEEEQKEKIQKTELKKAA